MSRNEIIMEYCLRLGDNGLILGHRLSEWCGHGPILEEDIAMGNMSLDLTGQARGFLGYAAKLEGKGRTEDELAYHRDAREFRNRMLVEVPNGDFAVTMMRSFLFSAAAWLQFRELSKSKDETISGLAAKSLKEVTYHLRHCSEWVIRLGDGTPESHKRVQSALDDLWMYAEELFEMDDIDAALIKEGIAVDLSSLKAEWAKMIDDILKRATLKTPEGGGYQAMGGIKGIHTEYLGYLLAEMQFLPRSYPGAQW
jgi:ring-1,2-phenylacetyl-CoA epoxidase subunit PaaC